MNKLKLALAVTLATSSLNALAVKHEPVEPNTPNKTETAPAKSDVKPYSVSDYPMNTRNTIFFSPSNMATRYQNFEVEPCESAFTAYHRFFAEMFPEPTSLLNECALGSLIDMQLLQGFDPFGKLLAAIRGAMCGFIKDEVHDPFRNAINKPMSKANQWVNSTNQSYGNWIDQEARNLQEGIYNPNRHYDKSGLNYPEGMGTPENDWEDDEPIIDTSIDSSDTIIQFVNEKGEIEYRYEDSIDTGTWRGGESQNNDGWRGGDDNSNSEYTDWESIYSN